MKQYNCPDCTHIEDTCYNCTRFLHQFDKYDKTSNFEVVWPYKSTSTTALPDACRSCPNHPSNGGSGNCNCILGLPQIT